MGAAGWMELINLCNFIEYTQPFKDKIFSGCETSFGFLSYLKFISWTSISGLYGRTKQKNKSNFSVKENEDKIIVSEVSVNEQPNAK